MLPSDAPGDTGATTTDRFSRGSATFCHAADGPWPPVALTNRAVVTTVSRPQAGGTRRVTPMAGTAAGWSAAAMGLDGERGGDDDRGEAPPDPAADMCVGAAPPAEVAVATAGADGPSAAAAARGAPTAAAVVAAAVASAAARTARRPSNGGGGGECAIRGAVVGVSDDGGIGGGDGVDGGGDSSHRATTGRGGRGRRPAGGRASGWAGTGRPAAWRRREWPGKGPPVAVPASRGGGGGKQWRRP